jgi:Fur family ferric uptake transcriptional regulator
MPIDMSNLAAEGLLKSFKLRLTPCRHEVISLFINVDYALSNSTLEEKVGKDYDRVTIYRTLRTFLDKGIIHKVLDDEGTPKYALCREKCDAHDHNHDHVHFKCLACGETNCIESVVIPKLKLPEGYQYNEANVLLQGVCKECNS